jgi:hypothetical protein
MRHAVFCDSHLDDLRRALIRITFHAVPGSTRPVVNTRTLYAKDTLQARTETGFYGQRGIVGNGA